MPRNSHPTILDEQASKSIREAPTLSDIACGTQEASLALASHYDDWNECQRCPLHSTTTQHVLGRGKLPCDVLFIGEAPGVSEDALGKPFIGPAGKVLDSLIGDVGKVREAKVPGCVGPSPGLHPPTRRRGIDGVPTDIAPTVIIRQVAIRLAPGSTQSPTPQAVMPKICYKPMKFKSASIQLINHANTIIAEYEAMGFDLTLRQLYYQMVSRDILANNQKEYKKLGSVVNDARLAGLIDWDRINDLTRELRAVSHWDDPSDIIASAAQSFRLDKWSDQPWRLEIWVEKDALRNVVERVATALDVPYFSCRGYVSQSEMWAASRRLSRHEKRGQSTEIIHLGDHDPSGIDMTRDIQDRLEMFGCSAIINRIALNMDQIEKYEPPPNPAKTTDSRFESYIALYGTESWELDALDPQTLTDLITEAVDQRRNEAKYTKRVKQEEAHRDTLANASRRWDDVSEFLSDDGE